MSVLNDGNRNEINYEYRKQEYHDREAEKGCCGNCRWHTKEALTEDWICDNENSDYCMDYTGYEDGCSEFERR
jgi:hypothetical protein